jgi:hypothetical protein
MLHPRARAGSENGRENDGGLIFEATTGDDEIFFFRFFFTRSTRLPRRASIPLKECRPNRA